MSVKRNVGYADARTRRLHAQVPSVNVSALQNIVRALKEAPADAVFDMQRYVHVCGTPACALGFYAAREDLQSFLTLRAGDMTYTRPDSDMRPSHRACYTDDQLCAHFGLKPKEMFLLFSSRGCDNAATREDAIEYLEGFIEAIRGVT